jgi:Acetyltransferase (GNAT) domain
MHDAHLVIVEEGDPGSKSWGRMLNAAWRPALEQSYVYGQVAQGLGRAVRRFVFRTPDGAWLAGAQLCVTRLGPLRLAHLVRGPFFAQERRDQAESLTPVLLRALRRHFNPWRGWFLLTTPDLPASPAFMQAMAGFGMGRVVTGYSTAWLDLSRPCAAIEAGFSTGFKKSLHKAERERLTTATSHGGHDLEWIIAAHDRHRRRRSLLAPPGSLAGSIAQQMERRGDLCVIAARQGSETLAAGLFFRHGRVVTYYLAAGTPQARQGCAQHLILRTALRHWTAEGAAWLDLGGLNAGAMVGVNHFKLSLGAVPITLAGTWA